MACTNIDVPKSVVEYGMDHKWSMTWPGGDRCEMTGHIIEHRFHGKTTHESLVELSVRRQRIAFVVAIDVSTTLAKCEEDDTYCIWDFVSDRIVSPFTSMHPSSKGLSATEVEVDGDGLLELLRYIDSNIDKWLDL